MQLRKPICEAVENLKLALVANVDWEINYVDVKLMNELHRKYHLLVKAQIKRYRAWLKEYEKQRDMRGVVYDSIEGRLILGELRLAYEVYREVTKDAVIMYNAYLKKSRGL